MATLRPDGFVALVPPPSSSEDAAGGGAGTATSVPLKCSAKHIMITADLVTPTKTESFPGYAIQVTATSALLPGGACTVRASPSMGNVTDYPLAGCDLTPAIGSNVTFVVAMQGRALLYTIGFTDTDPFERSHGG